MHADASAATRITATQTEFKDVRERALTLVRELIIQTYRKVAHTHTFPLSLFLSLMMFPETLHPYIQEEGTLFCS